MATSAAGAGQLAEALSNLESTSGEALRAARDAERTCRRLSAAAAAGHRSASAAAKIYREGDVVSRVDSVRDQAQESVDYRVRVYGWALTERLEDFLGQASESARLARAVHEMVAGLQQECDDARSQMQSAFLHLDVVARALNDLCGATIEAKELMESWPRAEVAEVRAGAMAVKMQLKSRRASGSSAWSESDRKPHGSRHQVSWASVVVVAGHRRGAPWRAACHASPTQVHGAPLQPFVSPVDRSRERCGNPSARSHRNAEHARRGEVIKVVFPITIDDVEMALIDLTNDAGHMSDIAVQTRDDMRAQEEAAHLLGQNVGAWRAVSQRSVVPHFDAGLDVATAALPPSMYAGGKLEAWRHAAGLAHAAAVTADGAAERAVEWAQVAEVAYREAADEAGGIAETFDGVCEAAGGWARAAAEAKARGTVQAVTLCVREVKAGLEEQVGPVEDLYMTLERRKATLSRALGEKPSSFHIYSAHPIVAERVTSGVRLCDAFERDLRVLVDDAGAVEHE